MITRHPAAAAIGALILTAAHISAHAAEVKVLSAVGMRQVMLDLRRTKAEEIEAIQKGGAAQLNRSNVPVPRWYLRQR